LQSESEVLQPPGEVHRRFLEIDEADKVAARSLWAILSPEISDIVGRFYAKLRRSEIAFYISDDVVERLKEKQRAHWAKLFGSQFDDEYLRSVRRVGIRHREIRLGSAWYVAGYMVLKMDIINCILRAPIPTTQKGIFLKVAEKYVALDMVIALSAYDNEVGVVD
jgi:hypothetical protein